MAHRKWKEAKQLPGTAGPGNMLGCYLIYFHFLWATHPIRPVYTHDVNHKSRHYQGLREGVNRKSIRRVKTSKN